MLHHRIKVIGLLIFLLLVAAGCNEGSEATKTPTMVAAETDLLTLEDGTEIYFPKVPDEEGPPEVNDVETFGILFLQQQCLYIEIIGRHANNGKEVLPIWPTGFEIKEENGQVFVYNEKGEIVAIENEVLVMGGGHLTKKYMDDLPEECHEDCCWRVGGFDAIKPTYSLNTYSQNSSIAEDVLLSDAMNYAKDYNLSIGESLKQLALQKSFVILHEKLLQNERETFAGAYIQHAPEYRFIARFTSDFKGDIQAYLPADSLVQYVELDTTAQYSMFELKFVQTELNYTLNPLSPDLLDFETCIKVRTNRVELYVADINDFNATLEEHHKYIYNMEKINVIEIGIDTKK
ncbi:MAG: hypothetical protein DRI56_06195 [Chloroflexota bacterium]|nr:MAG: hypothetical protein DRI56_06195 [Chloroflexota bacterium]